jgi:hypothetical protein
MDDENIYFIWITRVIQIKIHITKMVKLYIKAVCIPAIICPYQ